MPGRAPPDGNVSNTFKKNILIARPEQTVAYFYSTKSNLTSFGVLDSNYYCRPTNESLPIKYGQTGIGLAERSLATWQSFMSQDAHSTQSSFTVSDTTAVKLYYNATKTAKTIALQQPATAVDGTKYFDSNTSAIYTQEMAFR